MTLRGLFGGAIVGNLPACYADISNMRQVPDNQEVFVDNDTEASLIVELLELDSSLQGLAAIRHNFDDLAESNESKRSEVMSEGDFSAEVFVPRVQADTKFALIGKQVAGKYRTRPDMQEDEVYIILVLVRLTQVTTDLLVSMNIPAKELLSDGGATPEVQLAELTVANLLQSVEGPAAGRVGKHLTVLKDFISSLEIKDWSLFGSS
jgi:hypothetical protein